MTDDLFSDAIERLFSAHSTPQQVRAVEEGGSAAPLWREIHESGFADALVPEAQGGAGLGLMDVFGVLLACGGHALPAPLGPAMLARAVLAEAGREIPQGPIAIASEIVEGEDGALECPRTAYGLVSEWVLASREGACALLATGEATLTSTEVHGSLEGHLRWASPPLDRAWFSSAVDFRAAGAALFAAQLAGAMQRVFAMTVRYANERTQFGRSIGKFQAVQQQISVMAEQVYAARMAAEIGCASTTHAPDPLRAAVAKARAGEAAVPVAAIAHAVHGAIGITEEYDLQLFTRRLHEWRNSFGSETYWNRIIGESLLRDAAPTSLAFIRERLG